MIDGRRAEARRMKEIKSALIQHLGGNPSTAQRMLIDRIAALTLRLELMDKEALAGNPETERDARSYLAWSNALARMLHRLGLDGAAEGGLPHGTPDLSTFLKEKNPVR
jgi:hypothetical protein